MKPISLEQTRSGRTPRLLAGLVALLLLVATAVASVLSAPPSSRADTLNPTPSSAADAVRPASATGGIIQENSRYVKTAGTWKKISSSNDSGDAHLTNNGTGYISVTFTSNRISWISRTNAYSGIADVFIDGRKVARIDQYSKKTRYRQTLYTARNLSKGKHTLKVSATGKRNANASGRELSVDAFDIYDLVAPSKPAGLKASSGRTGTTLTWKAVTNRSIDHYNVYRSDPSHKRSKIATTASLTFADPVARTGVAYVYSVSATSTTGRTSKSTKGVVFSPKGVTGDGHRYSNCPTATVTVHNRNELLAATNRAKPGTVIRIANGHYSWPYQLTLNGTKSKPIWLCGSSKAIFAGPGVNENGGIKLANSSYAILTGFTVTNSQKGVSVLYSKHITISDLTVHHLGNEGIHLKNNTTDSTAEYNTIYDTGHQKATYGEGIYIGTAFPNWCKYNNCKTDASNRNKILYNKIYNTTSESIEAKEGAVDGLIQGNKVDGTHLVQVEADSPLAIQSSGWVVRDNTVHNSPLDGLQVWEVHGYGRNNVAYHNKFTGKIPGYAVRLAYHKLGNVVGCDNSSKAKKGLSNKSCHK